jgi:hypothetical protein
MWKRIEFAEHYSTAQLFSIHPPLTVFVLPEFFIGTYRFEFNFVYVNSVCQYIENDACSYKYYREVKRFYRQESALWYVITTRLHNPCYHLLINHPPYSPLYKAGDINSIVG